MDTHRNGGESITGEAMKQKKPKPLKSYTQWVSEDVPSDLNPPLCHKHFSRPSVEEATKLRYEEGEVGELYSSSEWKDSFRFAERLRQFREGLISLLSQDDRLDDELLGRFGLTKWDIPLSAQFDRPLEENEAIPAQREVAAARKQELIAKTRVLAAKQNALSQKQRKVQRDISNVKE